MIKQKSFKQIYTTQQTCPLKQTTTPNKLTQNNFDDQANIIQTNIYYSTNMPPKQTNTPNKLTQNNFDDQAKIIQTNIYNSTNMPTQTNKHTKPTNPTSFCL